MSASRGDLEGPLRVRLAFHLGEVDTVVLSLGEQAREIAAGRVELALRTSYATPRRSKLRY